MTPPLPGRAVPGAYTGSPERVSPNSRAGRAFVLGAEDAAPLQLGHDQAAEILERLGIVVAHDIEAVGSLFLQPCFHLVGHVLRRADQHAMAGARSGVAGDLAQGHVVLSRRLHDQRLARLGGVAGRQLGQWPVERILGKVEPARDVR